MGGGGATGLSGGGVMGGGGTTGLSGGGAMGGGAMGVGGGGTRGRGGAVGAGVITDAAAAAVESICRRTSCTTRVTMVALLSASGSTRSTPATAAWAGAASPLPTTSTKRTSLVDGSLRTMAHSSWPSISPSRARLMMTSCLFHSSIVSANDALGATETSAPPASSAAARTGARCGSGSTSSAFMPTPARRRG